MSDLDLLPPNQRLDIDRVRSLLTTTASGRELHYFVQTTSTMDDARRLAEEGAPHGTVVVADEQTAGRGTKGPDLGLAAGTEHSHDVDRPPVDRGTQAAQHHQSRRHHRRRPRDHSAAADDQMAQ